MKEQKRFDMYTYQDDVEIGEDELIARYMKLYGGTISDVLDGLGYTEQVLPNKMTGLTPDAKFCGTALTAAGAPTDIRDPDEIFIPGAVIYGGVRDVDYIHKLGLPVYKRYTTPKAVMGRWQLTAYNGWF